MQRTITEFPVWRFALAAVAVLFGLATLNSGGQVLFIDGAARRAAGAYVPFVVWFNFLAGFFYIAAGLGLWRGRRWAVWLALAIAVATLAAFAAFGVFIWSGRAYELRTVWAMTLRSVTWLLLWAVAWWRLARGSRPATSTQR